MYTSRHKQKFEIRGVIIVLPLSTYTIQQLEANSISDSIKIIVIGAGAAGMVAAAEAAHRGANVLLLEKNSKTGVKILMSGGTRCNITHNTDAKGILPAFGHAKRFLRASIGAFPPDEVVRMFTTLGVSTKVEPTGKVFPVSDRALDVRDALEQNVISKGAQILLGQGVASIKQCGTRWKVKTQHESYDADRVIVTSGGKSWPGCGTTGDGYAWLQSLGHTIIRTRPALVPIVGGDSWSKRLSGITLEDTIATAVYPLGESAKSNPRMSRRSSLLFTHFGFSGPAAMDISRIVSEGDDESKAQLTLDLLPKLGAEQIEQRLCETVDGAGRRHVATLLSDYLPSRLAEAVVQVSGVEGRLAELTKPNRKRLVDNLKRLSLPLTGTKGFKKAEVTAGGVSLDEVNPKTMQSKIAAGLFIAGEVLDVDGWIGGYNFQAAFSTGRAAGIAASTQC